MKTMMVTHFTLSADSVPTVDDLCMKSRKNLLIKLKVQNRYYNYGNYSRMNTDRSSGWYNSRDDMDKRMSCAICGSLDYHVSDCSTYKQT